MSEIKPYVPDQLVRDHVEPPVSETLRRKLVALGRPLPGDETLSEETTDANPASHS